MRLCFCTPFPQQAHLSKRTVNVPITTLSDVIDANKVKKIDVLKVDCEGAEWGVLCGVKKHHWKRVKAAVVEVHDGADGRVEKVRALLSSEMCGFDNVVVAPPEFSVHAALGIATVYATRNGDGDGDGGAVGVGADVGVRKR
jgi:hypothetical protein